MSFKHLAIATMAAFGCPGVMAYGATENFDHLPPQQITPDRPLVLDHFRVELPIGGKAAIRPVDHDGELASGMALGAHEDWTLSSLMLHFDQPWRRLILSLVLPPTEQPLRSLIHLYGKDPASPAAHRTLIWHGTDRRVARMELLRNEGESFQRVMLHLYKGAYVDNIAVEVSRDEFDLADE